MENDNTILRIEVLRLMDTGKAFSMSYVTYDKKRGTGGELKEVVNWCKMKTDIEFDAGPNKAQSPFSRNPEHRQYNTVNIYNPNDYRQHITKVHIPLITKFNGKIVVN